MSEHARARLLEAFDSLRTWRRGGERAVHKPLLILLMLGRLRDADTRMVPFTDIEEPLRDLLTHFGPPRPAHPEYPFWHLQTDGLWEAIGDAATGRKPAATPSLRASRTLQGGFAPAVWDILRQDPDTVGEVARRLLTAHFPPSLHEDILDRVGLAFEALTVPAPTRRDPRFRVEVLRAYEYQCAVCGFNGRLDTTPVAIDAAHIRWWAAGGPDDLGNGVALCVLHHKAFDLGAIGLSVDLRILVSRAFHGGDRTVEFVHRFAGAPLRRPQPGLPLPQEQYRGWHEREVFRGPPREHATLAADSPVPYG